MKEITNASPVRKPLPSDGPRPLTKQEIESLRQDAREGHEIAKTLLADVKPLK